LGKKKQSWGVFRGGHNPAPSEGITLSSPKGNPRTMPEKKWEGVAARGVGERVPKGIKKSEQLVESFERIEKGGRGKKALVV